MPVWLPLHITWVLSANKDILIEIQACLRHFEILWWCGWSIHYFYGSQISQLPSLCCIYRTTVTDQTLMPGEERTIHDGWQNMRDAITPNLRRRQSGAALQQPSTPRFHARFITPKCLAQLSFIDNARMLIKYYASPLRAYFSYCFDFGSRWCLRFISIDYLAFFHSPNTLIADMPKYCFSPSKKFLSSAR